MVATNPLMGWTLNPANVTQTGTGLVRPECVLARSDGCLWAANGSGGITHIDPDGTCRLIRQSQSGAPLEHAEPNGFAICPDGSFLVADRGRGELQRMAPDGEVRVLAEAIEQRSLEQINFVMLDHAGRVWVTVQTTASKTEAGRPDGFIARYENGRAWIVAEGFDLTNECRVDARGEWLYVVESTARRISRLPIGPDGTLGERETFGPDTLGPGFPDGMSFDAAGNLWIAMVLADRLIALTPEGEVLELADFGDAEATASMEAEFAALGVVTPETLQLMARRGLNLITSVTFGGEDLETVYLGSLAGSSLPTFRSPLPGLALPHW